MHSRGLIVWPASSCGRIGVGRIVLVTHDPTGTVMAGMAERLRSFTLTSLQSSLVRESTEPWLPSQPIKKSVMSTLEKKTLHSDEMEVATA